MISYYNTRFAKVKFKLKMTQLETIFYSCPERKLFRGNCLMGNCPEGNFMGGNFPGGNYSGAILRGAKTWRDNCPWGEFHGGRGQLSEG